VPEKRKSYGVSFETSVEKIPEKRKSSSKLHHLAKGEQQKSKESLKNQAGGFKQNDSLSSLEPHIKATLSQSSLTSQKSSKHKKDYISLRKSQVPKFEAISPRERRQL